MESSHFSIATLRRVTVGAVGLVLTIAPLATSAQQTLREVHGRVLRAGPKVAQPFGGAWVTLHRVATDHAGPLDSVRTDASGRYTFRYITTPADSAAIYFVSSTYAGIAHFTTKLQDRIVTGDAAELMLFDTTSAPVPITVRGRHLIVTAPDSTKTRSIVEVFELSNDSSVIRVPGAANRPTFEALLPDGASSARGGDGDISAESAAFNNGKAQVFAPLAPGVKQFSFSYRLPGAQRSLNIAVPVPTAVVEVLIEDIAGTAVGGGLKAMPAAIIDGRRFNRFLAQDVAANSVIEIHAPTHGRFVVSMRTAIIFVAVGALLLLMLSRGYVRRSRLLGARAGRGVDTEALARQIAILDDTFEKISQPSAGQRADHYEARARLKARLTASLAARDGLM